MTALPADYLRRVQAVLDELRIPSGFFAGRPLSVQHEALDLAVVEVAPGGREFLLTPPAAAAWCSLRAAAQGDGVTLMIVSAFRSVDRQAEIVREKLACGLALEAIFAASAPPGYSEHHTGRAVDVSTPGVRALEVEFEATAAYAWLERNAGRYGYALSYPRGNPHGYVYEPWHWCFQSGTVET